MNKKDYAMLHYLLAKLKYELQIEVFEGATEKYLEEIKKQLEAIDEVMKIFIVEMVDCE